MCFYPPACTGALIHCISIPLRQFRCCDRWSHLRLLQYCTSTGKCEGRRRLGWLEVAVLDHSRADHVSRIPQPADHHLCQHVWLRARPERAVWVMHLLPLTLLIACSRLDSPVPPCRSMVRAVEGMVKEKDAIFFTLLSTVVLFQFLALCCGFFVMEDYCAYISTVILAIGSYYWYTYCLRIYNRFKVRCSDLTTSSLTTTA